MLYLHILLIFSLHRLQNKATVYLLVDFLSCFGSQKPPAKMQKALNALILDKFIEKNHETLMAHICAVINSHKLVGTYYNELK